MLTKHLRRRRPGQKGLSLIEMIVAIAILAVIIVPLTEAFIVGLRSTKEIDLRLTNSASRQLLASYFTPDVVALDAEGLGNPNLAPQDRLPKDEPCPLPDPQPAILKHLVTLNSEIAVSAVSPPKKVTYWVANDGKDTELLRRECVADQAGALVTVAEKFGKPGVSRDNLVYGKAGPGSPVCDAYSCTIVVNGRFAYEVSGERRVVGLGQATNGVGTPFNVQAQAFNQRAIVSWNPPAPNPNRPVPDQYRIITYLANSGNPDPNTATITVPATTTTYTVTNLQNGTPYYFRIVAVASGVEGTLSDPSNTVTPSVQAPTAPDPLEATFGDKEIILSWGPPADTGGDSVTKYTVYCRTTPAGTIRSVDVNGDTTQTLLNRCAGSSDPLLVNGTEYELWVTAWNAAGQSPQSTHVLVTPRSKPSEPLNVTFRGDNGPGNIGQSFFVDWDAPLDNGGAAIEWYRVELYPFGDFNGTPVVVDLPASGGTQGVATSSSISNGTPYSVKVTANNDPAKREAFFGPQSQAGTRTGPTSIPPSAQSDQSPNYPMLAVPSGRPDAAVGLFVNGGTLTATWDRVTNLNEPITVGAPSNNGADIWGYQVEVYTLSDQFRGSITVKQPPGTPATVSAILPNVDPGGYYISMRTINHGEWNDTDRRLSATPTTTVFNASGSSTITTPANGALYQSTAVVYPDESTWPDKLSYPASADVTDVNVAFYQMRTGRYFSGLGFLSTTPSYRDMTLVGSEWRFNWSEADFDQAGEYRVTYQVTSTSPVLETTTVFHVDWVQSNTVFLRDGGTGDGLTPNTAAGTLQNALDALRFTGRKYLAAAVGTWPKASGDLTSVTLDANYTGKVITGGHVAASWLRRAPGQSEVQISRPGTGVLVDGATNLTLRQLRIAGTNSGLGAGSSVYGLRVVNGSSVTLTNSVVSAAAGVAGTAGSTGATGGAGSGGGQGEGTCCNDTADWRRTPGGGGAGVGASGGSGGWGANEGDNNGSGGSQGGNSGGTGGGGGDGKDSWDSSDAGGGGGGNGGGSVGGGAAGSAGTYTVSGGAATWAGSTNGGSGGTGANGRGGGGGGGGGGSAWANDDQGAGGGGGGGAGGGGAPGTGGTAGGGSFGVYVYNATVTFATGTTSVTAANGGAGGAGGTGGAGGAGGPGGRGGGCDGGQEGGGGGGGGGGSGGGGGGGGGGGAGGPSFAIYENGSGTVAGLGNSTRTAGSAGAGGARGSGGGGGGGGAAGGNSGGGGCNAGGVGGTGATSSGGNQSGIAAGATAGGYYVDGVAG